MSTRYVWAKYTYEYKMGVSSPAVQTMRYIPKGTFSGSSGTLDSPRGYISYVFDKTTGRFTGSSASASMPSGAYSNPSSGIDVQVHNGGERKYQYLGKH